MERLIKIFLSGIFDYAGLFPPASLPLHKAMEKYIEYRQSKYDWLLSRFVISHSNLEDLYDLSAREPKLPDPLRLAIVSAASESISNYLNQLELIKQNILKIHKSLRIKLKTDVLEIKLPNELKKINSVDEIVQILDKTTELLGNNHLLPSTVFFEIPGFDFSKEIALSTIKALKKHNETLSSKDYEFYQKSGFKIRCGGIEAFHFPSPEYLAYVISAATSHKVPLKYTAGLHHPYRAYNESVKTEMHGFINVLSASFFSAAKKMNEEEIIMVLLDENPSNFNFANEGVKWKNYRVSLNEIRDLRHVEVTNIGSCSIKEPVEDLKKLKLIV